MHRATFLGIFALLVWVQAFYYHKISPERIAVNQNIKERFPQISISESIPGGHLNNSETVDDILKAIGKSNSMLSQSLLLLRGSNAVKAGYRLGGRRKPPQVVHNELSSSLPASSYYAQLDQEEEQALYPLLKRLAVAYRNTFKQDYGIAKEIYLIPIGKLPSLWRTEVEYPSNEFVIGVLHKMNGRLSGIAALVVDTELFG
uniref:Uncharacterized protein n=1 Tax=Ditylenchus dipsaci TaxID=166011 RepID=A0A915DDI9_9BILA